MAHGVVMDLNSVRQLIKDLHNGTLTAEDEELLEELTPRDIGKIADAVTHNTLEDQLSIIKDEHKRRKMREKYVQRRQLQRQQTADTLSASTMSPRMLSPRESAPSSPLSVKSDLQDLLRRRGARMMDSPVDGAKLGALPVVERAQTELSPTAAMSKASLRSALFGPSGQGSPRGLHSSPSNGARTQYHESPDKRVGSTSPGISPARDQPFVFPLLNAMSPKGADAAQQGDLQKSTSQPMSPSTPATGELYNRRPTFHSLAIELEPDDPQKISEAPACSIAPEPTRTLTNVNDLNSPESPNNSNWASLSRPQRKFLKACETNDLARAHELLMTGVDVNIKTGNRLVSGLWIAADKGHMDIIRSLVEKGADPNTADIDGATALYIASKNGHLPVVKFLLEAQANVDEPKKSGATPLLTAVHHGLGDVVRCLCDNKADVLRAMGNGTTPLIMACISGQVSVAKYLIAQGANVKQPLMNKNAVLWALEANNEEAAAAVSKAHLMKRKVRVHFNCWVRYTRRQKERRNPKESPSAAARNSLYRRLAELEAEEPNEKVVLLLNRVRSLDTSPPPAQLADIMRQAVDAGMVDVGPLHLNNHFKQHVRREQHRFTAFAKEKDERLAPMSCLSPRSPPSQMPQQVSHTKTQNDWKKFKQQLKDTESFLASTIHVLDDSWMYAAEARALFVGSTACAQREHLWTAQGFPPASDPTKS